MRATFQNTATTLSITWIFSMVTVGLAQNLPATMSRGLIQAGIPAAVAHAVAKLPPTAALFAAFLGYNPMGTLLPPAVVQAMPAAAQAEVLGKSFFPNLLAGPFASGLGIAFTISAALSLLAALASLLRGRRVVHPVQSTGSPAALDGRVSLVYVEEEAEAAEGVSDFH
jgi:hypothetical protein